MFSGWSLLDTWSTDWVKPSVKRRVKIATSEKKMAKNNPCQSSSLICVFLWWKVNIWWGLQPLNHFSRSGHHRLHQQCTACFIPAILAMLCCTAVQDYKKSLMRYPEQLPEAVAAFCSRLCKVLTDRFEPLFAIWRQKWSLWIRLVIKSKSPFTSTLLTCCLTFFFYRHSWCQNNLAECV